MILVFQESLLIYWLVLFGDIFNSKQSFDAIV